MLSEVEIGEQERRIPELAGVAFAEGYRMTLAAGLSVLVSDHGLVVEVFPDGARKGIKQIGPLTFVAQGGKLRLRKEQTR